MNQLKLLVCATEPTTVSRIGTMQDIGPMATAVLRACACCIERLFLNSIAVWGSISTLIELASSPEDACSCDGSHKGGSQT